MNETVICPWSQYPPGNFPLCEEKLCEWIKQPLNTYTNIAFLIFATYLIYLFYKKQSAHGLGFALCAIFIGAASFMAHASGTKFFGVLDFAAIFTAFSLYAAKNMIYTKTVQTKNVLIVFLVFFIPATVILFSFTFLREIIFATFVIGLLISENRILKAQGKPFLTSSNKKLLTVFGIAVVCLGLDAGKIICDPQNHWFQMHAIWHICNAASIYLLARHLDQHRPT